MVTSRIWFTAAQKVELWELFYISCFCRGHRPTRKGRLITASRKQKVRGLRDATKKGPGSRRGARGFKFWLVMGGAMTGVHPR
jgi:hypothetical protein